jgi:putative transposase
VGFLAPRIVNAKVLQMILKTLHGNYQSFFALRKNGDPDAQPPGFKGWRYFTMAARMAIRSTVS